MYQGGSAHGHVGLIHCLFVYVTAVSSAAAGVTEAFKSIIPFLSTDYEPKEDCWEDQNEAARLMHYKRFFNLLISVLRRRDFWHARPGPGADFDRSGFGLRGKSMAGRNMAVGHYRRVRFPVFASVLKILEGFKQSVNNSNPPNRPRQKVSGPRE